MKKIIPLITILIIVVDAYSQQIPPLSQYAYNHYLINPAAAGTNDSVVSYHLPLERCGPELRVPRLFKIFQAI